MTDILIEMCPFQGCIEVLEEADKLFLDKQEKYEDFEILLQILKKNYIFYIFLHKLKSLYMLLLLV